MAACGGGGSSSPGTAGTVAAPASTLITGTAAAGAPVVGFVSVRDASANAQPVLTNIEIKADGKYTVDVKGLTPPFAFLATGEVGGKRIELYSAATQADVGGTINITPFTDLIVRNVAGTVAGTLVDDFIASGKFKNLTAAQVETERVSLTAKLGTVMQAAGLATSIDLMRASFNADGTGLDRFMDLVKVDTTVPTAVTITNILDDTKKLTVNTQTGTTTGGTTLSATGITDGKTPIALTAADLIRQTFKTFSDSFATQMPKSDDPAITALFASSFMDDGESSGAVLTDITGNKELIGMKFGGNGLVIDSIDDVNGTAQVSFVPVSATGEHLASDARSGVIQWQMKKVGTAWLIDGNQRIASVRVRAAVGRNVCSDNAVVTFGCTSKSATGLTLDVFNHGLRAIGSAVVKGPGLPDAGVKLVAQVNNDSFWIESYVNSTVNFVNSSLYEMDDVAIGKLGANGTYTVALFDTANPAALLATYTEVVTAAPVLNTALASLAFPELGGRISLTNFAGGTLTPTWTIPTGLKGDTASAFVLKQSATAGSGPNANLENQNVQFNLSGKAATGTANMVFTAPTSGGVWTGGGYWIQAWDANDRKVFTSYQQ